MIKAMTIRSLSPTTQRRYLSAVSKFSWYLADALTVLAWNI
jgi:hypothetical protein